MNKKAMIFHWILFGFLIALGVFFVLSFKEEIKLLPKGQWQVDFLNNYYYAAEKDLINQDLLVKQTAGETIFQIALNGGFHNKIPCNSLLTKSIVICNIEFA